MLTRKEARDLVDAIHGAHVESAELVAGVIVLELFHRGTDDGARRVVFAINRATADAWPWPDETAVPA